MLADDRLWGDIWVLPYVKRHPDLAWVVEDSDGQAIGYSVSAPDTKSFNEWFGSDWWPEEGRKYPKPPPIVPGQEPTKDQQFYQIAESNGKKIPHESLADFPAHLHIDLLPPAQGQGFGRKLIMTILRELKGRGVKGVHLMAHDKNDAACLFYDKIGFEERPAPFPGTRLFVWDLTKPLP